MRYAKEKANLNLLFFKKNCFCLICLSCDTATPLKFVACVLHKLYQVQLLKASRIQFKQMYLVAVDVLNQYVYVKYYLTACFYCQQSQILMCIFLFNNLLVFQMQAKQSHYTYIKQRHYKIVLVQESIYIYIYSIRSFRGQIVYSHVRLIIYEKCVMTNIDL